MIIKKNWKITNNILILMNIPQLTTSRQEAKNNNELEVSSIFLKNLDIIPLKTNYVYK